MEIVSLQAGSLPLSTGTLLDYISEAARREHIDISWYRQEGHPVAIMRFQADLSRVTELFLTGTTSEVLPIVSVDGRPIGEGRPGPVTRRLQEAYAEAVKEFAGSTSI